MKISFNIKALLFFLLISMVNTAVVSQVWPGDVNNNGVVNAVDFIYFSKALGEMGPARPGDQMGTEWEEKTITSFWGIDFPGTSIDIVFADCDGDGEVTIFDEMAINENFQEVHGPVDVDVIIAGIPGTDPGLFLQNESTNPFPQGETILMKLQLGTADIPIETFTGISFDIEYDPTIVNAVFFFPAGQDMPDWGGAELMAFQKHIPDEGRTSFAFSTTGMTTVENGFGMLGQFFIVIEDDVVGMTGDEIETSIMLEKVILLGPDLDPAPVVNDTITVKIVENPLDADDLLDPESVEIFPNPALDYIYIKTNHQINKIEVFNTLGQSIQSFNGESLSFQQLDLSGFSPGIHLLKMLTKEGVLTKKVFIE